MPAHTWHQPNRLVMAQTNKPCHWDSYASCARLTRQCQTKLPARMHKAVVKTVHYRIQSAIDMPDTLTPDFFLFTQNFERQTKQGES